MKKILHQHIEPPVTQPNGGRRQRVVNFWDDGSMTTDYYTWSATGPMQIEQVDQYRYAVLPDAPPYSLRQDKP